MAKAARRRSKPRASTRAKPAAGTLTRAKAAADKFTSDLVTRGEAAERDAAGKVPRHATHVLTHDAAGHPVVRRVKFKTY